MTNQIKKSALQKKIEIVNWVLLAVATALSLVFFSYKFALGILAGGLISIVNFYWLAKDLKALFERFSGTGKSKQFILVRYFFRLVVTAVVLFLVITKVSVHVIGLVLGLSTVIVSSIFTVVFENIINS